MPPAEGGFRFAKLGAEEGREREKAVSPVFPLQRVGVEGASEGPRRLVTQAIQGSETSQQEIALDIYNRAMETSKCLMEKAKRKEVITGKEIADPVKDIVRDLSYGNKGLLNLACSQVVGEDSPDFIAAKMVNKTILAIEIGIGKKKMNASDLFQLGMAAFLCDIGVTQVLDIVTKKEVLTPGDWEKIRKIPFKTVEILKRISDIDQVVLTVAQEFRERPDGSGPLGIKDLKELDPFSRIVALIDVFEALVHHRPHRPRLLPHEAMRRILEEGGKKFEEGALRLLIDRVGIFPIGSWVRLTSKEIARVIAANPGQPLRPRVKVLFDEKGRPLEETYSVDLAKIFSVQILQPIPEEEFLKVVKEPKP